MTISEYYNKPDPRTVIDITFISKTKLTCHLLFFTLWSKVTTNWKKVGNFDIMVYVGSDESACMWKVLSVENIRRFLKWGSLCPDGAHWESAVMITFPSTPHSLKIIIILLSGSRSKFSWKYYLIEIWCHFL